MRHPSLLLIFHRLCKYGFRTHFVPEHGSEEQRQKKHGKQYAKQSCRKMPALLCLLLTGNYLFAIIAL
jgi:hypothetical protein